MEIDWDSQGLRLARSHTVACDRRATAARLPGIFGFAGTNAHVIVSLPEVA